MKKIAIAVGLFLGAFIIEIVADHFLGKIFDKIPDRSPIWLFTTALFFLIFSYLGLSTLFLQLRLRTNGSIIEAVIADAPPTEEPAPQNQYRQHPLGVISDAPPAEEIDLNRLQREAFGTVFVTYAVENTRYTTPYGWHTNKKAGATVKIRVSNANPKDISPTGAGLIFMGFFFLVIAAGTVLGFIAQYMV